MKPISILLMVSMAIVCTLKVSAKDTETSKTFKLNFELPIPWVDYHKRPTQSTVNQNKAPVRTTSYDKFGHWKGFYFHYSNLADNNRKINQFDNIEVKSARSYGWSLNLLEASTNITQKGNVLLVTGLGYDWNKYRFQNGVTLQNVGDKTYIIQPGWVDVRSSIIKTEYVTVPLLLDWKFRINQGRKAFISVGIVENINTRFLSRMHYVNGAGTIVRKDIHDLHSRFLRTDIMAQIGIGKLCFTASYSPQSMFQSDHGPDLRPVSIGIRITPFDD